MTYYSGRKMLLMLGPQGAEGYIAGCKETAYSISNGQADITNKDSGGWASTLPGAGTRNLSITISGVVTNQANFNKFHGYAMNDIGAIYYLAYKDNSFIEAEFAITSFQITGNEGAGQLFSATLNSNGYVTHGTTNPS